MESTKVIKDGSLEVHTDGAIYKILQDGSKTPATLYQTGKDNEYRAISIQEEGKQRHYLTHRLIAEAFLPNPDSLPIVLHKNGNLSDNRVENLMWSNNKERIKQSIKEKQKPCLICGTPTCAMDQICTKCKVARRQAEKVKENNRMTEEKITNQFSDIDLSILSPREAEAVQLRMKFMTYEQIANKMGCSRQYIEQSLHRALSKKAVGPKPRAVQRRKRTALINELTKLQCKKTCLENKIKDLQEEISYLENRMKNVSEQIAETPGAATPRESK